MKKFSRNYSLEQATSSGDKSCKVCRNDIADLCPCCQAYYCSLRCANVIRRHKFFCIPEEDYENNSVHTKQKRNLSSQPDNSRSINLRHMRNRNEKTYCSMTVFEGQDSSSDEVQYSVISKPKRQSDVSSPQENARSIDLRHMRNRNEKTDFSMTVFKGQDSSSDEVQYSVISKPKRQSNVFSSLKREKPNQKRSLDSHLRHKQSDVHNEELQTYKGLSENVRRKQKDLRNENRHSFKGRETYSKCDTDSKTSKKTPPKRTEQKNYEKSPEIQKEPGHSDAKYIPPKSNRPLPLGEHSKASKIKFLLDEW